MSCAIHVFLYLKRLIHRFIFDFFCIAQHFLECLIIYCVFMFQGKCVNVIRWSKVLRTWYNVMEVHLVIRSFSLMHRRCLLTPNARLTTFACSSCGCSTWSLELQTKNVISFCLLSQVLAKLRLIASSTVDVWVLCLSYWRRIFEIKYGAKITIITSMACVT